MKPKEFIEELNYVRELMVQEKYFDAQKTLEKLKKSEKDIDQDYNYELIHQLYQLDSNCRSALNQQIILNFLKNVSIKRKSITFNELNQKLKGKAILNLSEEVLRREVELLILRNQLQCEIDEDKIIL